MGQRIGYLVYAQPPGKDKWYKYEAHPNLDTAKRRADILRKKNPGWKIKVIKRTFNR